MKTNRFILTALLMLFTISISAQTTQESKEARTAELREKIGIDYSMPDFNTSSLNGKVIGERLAKMLQLLQDRYDDYALNQRISYFQCEQIENLLYVKIEKFKITNISKQGDVITIKAKTKLSPNSAKIKNAVMKMSFDKGVSESTSINDLFADLSRYIKE